MAKTPSMEEFELMRAGGQLASVLPVVKKEIEASQNLLIRQTLGLLRQGTLTPEIALSRWQELEALNKVIKRLEQHVTTGTSVSVEMENDDG